MDYRFHLAVGSRFENIELVQVVLKDCLQRIGMDDDAQHWVDVAVREALGELNQVVVIDHGQGRGFCAGGDDVMLWRSGNEDAAEAKEFFFAEYRLNPLLFT